MAVVVLQKRNLHWMKESVMEALKDAAEKRRTSFIGLFIQIKHYLTSLLQKRRVQVFLLFYVMTSSFTSAVPEVQVKLLLHRIQGATVQTPSMLLGFQGCWLWIPADTAAFRFRWINNTKELCWFWCRSCWCRSGLVLANCWAVKWVNE